MNYKNLNSSSSNDVLILTNEVTLNNDPLILTNEVTINTEILKIKKLIEKKYLTLELSTFTIINEDLIENISKIKNSTLLINQNIQDEKLKISNNIKDKESELKLFNIKKKNLTNEIIKLQKDEYSIQQKANYKKNQIIINKDKRIQFLEINNNELKNEINRTKEINYSDNKNPKFDELHQKIKFYQNENVRLSSELSKSQKMTIVANENLSNIENTKNIIFNQIQELQRSLGENNVVNSKFIKENYDYIEPDIKENTDVNLNVLVSEIFDKK